jgi:hypothetical protein
VLRSELLRRIGAGLAWVAVPSKLQRKRQSSVLVVSPPSISQAMAVDVLIRPATPGESPATWYPSGVGGGGRGQAVKRSKDGDYAISNGDLGGSAWYDPNEDPTGLHEWRQSNWNVTDPNNHRPGDSVYCHPTVNGNCYKLTHASSSGAWKSTDRGKNFTRDTSGSGPDHQDGQPGPTSTARSDSYMPRLTGQLITVDPTSGYECWGDNSGLKRYRPGTGWDDISPATGIAACVFDNPENRKEVWCILADSSTGTYRTRMYRCTDITVATPTWAGPYTNTNAAGYWFPQEGRHNGSSVVVINASPHAGDADDHGIWVLSNSQLGTINAAWASLYIRAYTTGGIRLCSLAMEYDGTKTTVIGTFGNGVDGTDPILVLGEHTGRPSSSNAGTYTTVTNQQPNLVNNVAGETWCYRNPGTNPVSPFRGFVTVDINPADHNEVLFGGYQGFYVCHNMLDATPDIYPASYGAGGAVEPSNAMDPRDNGCMIFGLSDEGCAGAKNYGATPKDVGHTLLPPAFPDQTHGTQTFMCSDGVILVGFYGNGGQGVFRHAAINPASAITTWDDTDLLDEGFPQQDHVYALHAWYNSAVTKTNSTRVILAAYYVDGSSSGFWRRKVGTGSVAAPSTPPGVSTRKTSIDNVADGDGRAACYSTAGPAGLYITDDYGATWTRILSGTIGALSDSNQVHWAGFLSFEPGSSGNVLYVASDTTIWRVTDPFGTPGVSTLSGGPTRPGPIICDEEHGDLLVHNRNTSTLKAEMQRTPFGASPSWTIMDDTEHELYANSTPYARDISCVGGIIAITSQFTGTIIYR